jgi:hypothetical protein
MVCFLRNLAPPMRFDLLVFLLPGLLLLACETHGAAGTPRGPVPAQPAVHAVTVSLPSAHAGLATGELDAQREPVTIACATCHAARRAKGRLPERAEQLAGPHAGLSLEHGGLACAACHDASDTTSLHLADGRKLPLAEAQQLCSQCHGLQARDYAHGAHGGMRGYWDLSRGPRERNACVSCHDPHTPAYPQYLPMPAPRDRFAHVEHVETEHD